MADRLVRFSVIPDGGTAVEYDYVVDELMVQLEYEASPYTYLDDSVEPEFRRVRMKFDLKGVFEAKSGTTPITGTALWFEMLKGSAVTFYPMGDSGPLTRVIPDVRHTPTVVAFKGGMRRRKNSLRFAENEWRQPTDTHFDDFKDLIANL